VRDDIDVNAFPLFLSAWSGTLFGDAFLPLLSRQRFRVEFSKVFLRSFSTGVKAAHEQPLTPPIRTPPPLPLLVFPLRVFLAFDTIASVTPKLPFYYAPFLPFISGRPAATPPYWDNPLSLPFMRS